MKSCEYTVIAYVLVVNNNIIDLGKNCVCFCLNC